MKNFNNNWPLVENFFAASPSQFFHILIDHISIYKKTEKKLSALNLQLIIINKTRTRMILHISGWRAEAECERRNHHGQPKFRQVFFFFFNSYHGSLGKSQINNFCPTTKRGGKAGSLRKKIVLSVKKIRFRLFYD